MTTNDPLGLAGFLLDHVMEERSKVKELEELVAILNNQLASANEGWRKAQDDLGDLEGGLHLYSQYMHYLEHKVTLLSCRLEHYAAETADLNQLDSELRQWRDDLQEKWNYINEKREERRR